MGSRRNGDFEKVGGSRRLHGGARMRRVGIPRAEHLRRVAPVVVLTLTALLLALPASAFAKPRKAALDLRLERNSVIVNHDYRRLPPIGRGGAMGANIGSSGFSLAHQQLGGYYVRAGLAHRKPQLIKRGFRAFDFAFRRQRSDGSLPASQAEEYAFFLEAVAHSGLLVRASNFAPRFRGKLRGYESRLRRAAEHVIAPAAFGAFKGRNASYTHSGYVMGTALGLSGKFIGSGKLRAHGRQATEMAIRRQRGNGVNPELGGYDVRYQMAGIVYAARYRVYFPTGRIARRLDRMTNRGLRWMSRRVDRGGYIKWRGSTRSCREKNSNGSSKTPGYSYAIRGFAYWGAFRGRSGHLDEARRIRRYARRANGSLCGPKERRRDVRPPGRGRERGDQPRRLIDGLLGDGVLDSARTNDLLE